MENLNPDNCKPGDLVFIKDNPDDLKYFRDRLNGDVSVLTVTMSPYGPNAVDCVEVRNDNGDRTGAYYARLYRNRFKEAAIRAIRDAEPTTL